MPTVTQKELMELRDKYVTGIHSIDADIARLKNDRLATEGAVKALTALIDSLEPAKPTE